MRETIVCISTNVFYEFWFFKLVRLRVVYYIFQTWVIKYTSLQSLFSLSLFICNVSIFTSFIILVFRNLVWTSNGKNGKELILDIIGKGKGYLKSHIWNQLTYIIQILIGLSVNYRFIIRCNWFGTFNTVLSRGYFKICISASLI